MTSPPAAYDGLYELSNECWRCLADRVYMTSMSVPRFPIIGNAPGVFDDIRLFLENLLAWLKNWSADALSDIPKRLHSVFYGDIHKYGYARLGIFGTISYFMETWNTYLTNIQTALLGLPAKLHTIFYGSIYEYGYGRLGVFGTIEYIISALPVLLQTAISNGLWVLLNPLQATTNLLSPFYNSMPSWIRDPLNNLTCQVRDRFWEIQASIAGCVASLRTGLAAIVSNAAETIRAELFWLRVAADWIRSVLPTHLSMIGVAAVTQLWNTIMAFVPALPGLVASNAALWVGTTISVGLPLVSQLWAGVSSIPATYLNWIAATCGTDLAMNPTRALTSIAGLYAMSIIAGTAAHGISAALNLFPTLNWVGAAQLAGLVSQAAAFDPLTKATYGVLINDVLTVPLRYHWNQQMRPYLPTIGEIYTMGRKHGLSMAEFQTAMGYQGLPNWWIEKIYDFFWTDPSPMWLLRMTEGGIPGITTAGRKGPWLDQWIPNWRSDPMAWLRMKLMLSGFEDIDIDPMISGMRMRSVTASVTGAKTAAKAMMHEAYWTEANAAKFLTPLGVRPEEIHMLAVAEELDFQKAYLDDQVAYYVAAFAKGQISDQALNLALTTIYVRPERVAQVISREKIRKLPATKVVTPVELNPAVTRLRTQAINSWIAQYHAWAISEDDLLLSLTIIVQDPALARAMVNVETTRFRPVPPKLPPPAEDPLLAASRRQAIATWIAAFRDGTIIASELELYLEPLITDTVLRRQLVALENLRYSPTPELIALATENEEIAKVRAEYVRGHIELFAKRQLNVKQLYQYLQVDGLVEPLARATAITQATKRIKMPAIDSPYYLQAQHAELIDVGLQMYEDAYMAGEITLAQYEAWLTTLAKDQDVVTYLADVLALRKFAGSV